VRARRQEGAGPAAHPQGARRLDLPRYLFVNKIDRTEGRLRDVLDYLQPASSKPLVLRQVPIWKEGACGRLRRSGAGARLHLPRAGDERGGRHPRRLREREKEARFKMLEKLADYDDELLEQLLSDEEPPPDRVFADLSRELAEGLITPVLFGSAEHGNGILRLLKALRHEAPGVAETRSGWACR
jgi:elongation factor G